MPALHAVSSLIVKKPAGSGWSRALPLQGWAGICDPEAGSLQVAMRDAPRRCQHGSGRTAGGSCCFQAHCDETILDTSSAERQPRAGGEEGCKVVVQDHGSSAGRLSPDCSQVTDDAWTVCGGACKNDISVRLVESIGRRKTGSDCPCPYLGLIGGDLTDLDARGQRSNCAGILRSAKKLSISCI